MRFLNFIALKLFLISTSFFIYAYARYPFISTEFIEYKEGDSGNMVPKICGVMTFLPLSPRKKNCAKIDNPFRGDEKYAGKMEKKAAAGCTKHMNKTKEKYFILTVYDKDSLHDVMFMCGNPDVCKDLEDEVNLNIFWNRKVKQNTTKTKECTDLYNNENIYSSSCPFSTRIDLQHYLFTNERKHRIRNTMNDTVLCTDRYGRKYPPPEGLGGKCVMFQHEFMKDGERITELFMPIEKRDLVQRIAQYPYEHLVRKNETYMNRLLPKNFDIKFPVSNCSTLHYDDGMFFHCVYDPNQSHLFLVKNQTHFECPKNEHVNLSSIPKKRNGDSVYTFQQIDDDHFEFSDYCYLSIEFIPHPENISWNQVYFEMSMSFLGSKEASCPTKYHVSPSSNYTTVMKNAIEDLCPWDQNTSYTLCFQLSSKEIMTNFFTLYMNLINAHVFDQCYYQSPHSKYGCYIAVDPKIRRTFRLPTKWIKKIERNELIATKNEWKKFGKASAFVYFTSEMKHNCLTKLNEMSDSPIPGLPLDAVKMYFAGNTKSFVAKCHTASCNDPNKLEYWLNEMDAHNEENPLNCFEGIRDKSIDNVETNSSTTFFCSIQLLIYHERGQKLRRYTFSSYLPNDFPVETKDCWTFDKLSHKMKDSEVDANKIHSCHHDFKSQIIKCCCRAAKDACNKVDIVNDYYEIINTAATENQKRIVDGCRFHANTSRKNVETCKSTAVRNNREMKCYGVFQFPATSNDGGNLIKPKLIKENCYWPHPHYHD
uniref:Uncharacterized protein n=1 Tax=Panagrolaimus sp. ES5 TaxID=591445 RepID=A0AC34GRK4_9BILA